MDLKLTPRGNFVIENGGFGVVRTMPELLSQYLNAVLTDRIRSSTFPSLRGEDVKYPSRLSSFRLQVQQGVIDIIKSSPFSYDFEADRVSVTVDRTGNDSIFVGIGYLLGEGEELRTGFTFDGGRLVLPEESEDAYIPSSQSKIIEEEVVILNPTDEIDVSCEPSGELYICPAGNGIKTETLILELKDFPDTERVIKTNLLIDGILYESFGSSQTQAFGLNFVDGSYIGPETFTHDSFLMSTFLKNRGQNFKLMDVRVLSGNVRLMSNVIEAEDWFFQVDINQERITVQIDYLEVVETAQRFFYSDVKTYGMTDQYPFREEAVRGRKYYELDTLLNPGVYSIFYNGLVKNRYNGSLEEV